MLRLACVLVLVVVSGCASPVMPTPGPTPPRTFGPGELAVPVELWQPINGIPVACGGVGFVGEDRLHGSPTDRRIVWMTMADGTRRELAWPLGYRARFAPGLELLNESGKLVGVEGSLLVGGCQTPIEGVWWVELETLRPTAAPGP